MPHRRPVLLSMLGLVLLAFAAAVPARADETRHAVIFIDPRATDWEFKTQSARVLYEKSWYESRGYVVSLYHATDKLIVEAILHPQVEAISFFGHGYDPAASDATSTMLFIDSTGWTNRVIRTLRQKHVDEGMAARAATELANKELEAMKLETLRVHACSSLSDTKLAHALVRPGGSYFGVPGYYAACPTPYALYDDVNFMLEEYRVPLPAVAPGGGQGYDPTLPGGPCAVDLGPAGGCAPGFDSAEPCIPCPNRDQGVMQYYTPPQQ